MALPVFININGNGHDGILLQSIHNKCFRFIKEILRDLSMSYIYINTYLYVSNQD